MYPRYENYNVKGYNRTFWVPEFLLVGAEWRIYASPTTAIMVQIIACRLAGVELLSEPTLEYFNWTPGS